MLVGHRIFLSYNRESDIPQSVNVFVTKLLQNPAHNGRKNERLSHLIDIHYVQTLYMGLVVDKQLLLNTWSYSVYITSQVKRKQWKC